MSSSDTSRSKDELYRGPWVLHAPIAAPSRGAGAAPDDTAETVIGLLGPVPYRVVAEPLGP